MNYFAHGVAFLDRPYLMAGTAVPDWLVVADRQLRVRPRHVEAWQNQFCPSAPTAEEPIGQVAQGILQHLADDQRFHRTEAFLDLSFRLSQQAAEILDGQKAVHLPAASIPEKDGASDGMLSVAATPSHSLGFSSAFVGHLLLEVLLDAALIEEKPARLDQYYQSLEQVDAQLVQEAVNRMAPRCTTRLAPMIVEFRQLRVLWDYLEDRKLLFRLNQVMRRVGLAPLPETFLELLPTARQEVASGKHLLLEGIPTHCNPFPLEKI